jgi:hypothetical protein
VRVAWRGDDDDDNDNDDDDGLSDDDVIMMMMMMMMMMMIAVRCVLGAGSLEFKWVLHGFSRVLQGWVLQGCYKGATRVLQGCYNGATRVLPGYRAWFAGESACDRCNLP